MTRARPKRELRRDPDADRLAALAQFAKGFPPDELVFAEANPMVVMGVVAWGRERYSRSVSWYQSVAAGRAGPVTRNTTEADAQRADARRRVDEALDVLGVLDDIEAKVLAGSGLSFDALAAGRLDPGWAWR